MTEAIPIRLTFTFDGPRNLVYELYNKEEVLQDWISTKGCKLIQFKMDFRIGGNLLYCLERPAGKQVWQKQVFLEIVPNEKLVSTSSLSDQDGNLRRLDTAPEWPLEILSSVSFEEGYLDKTIVIIAMQPHNSDEAGNKAFNQARDSMKKAVIDKAVGLRNFLEKFQEEAFALRASQRLSFLDSCQFLLKNGYSEHFFELAEWDGKSEPPIPSSMPHPLDEDICGLRFFHTRLGEADSPIKLENLSLPRTYVNRSEFCNVSCVNTNFSESFMCWNDFLHVDFTNCDFRSADLRSSVFEDVSFTRCNLENTDLRHSSFDRCDFNRAKMRACKISFDKRTALTLSKLQIEQVEWCYGGEEPPGG